MRKKLADTIRKERLLREKTQEEVAQVLGITRATYGYYENGKVLPPIDKVILLSKYFEVSVDYLVGNEEKGSLDVAETLTFILRQLHKNSDELKFSGHNIEDLTSNLLACSLEHSIEITKLTLKGDN